jgi:hypothetical protein
MGSDDRQGDFFCQSSPLKPARRRKVSGSRQQGAGGGVSMADLSPILQVAADILSGLPGRRAHVDEIAQEACRRNMNMEMSSDALSAKLAQALASHVKKGDAQFARVIGRKDESGKAISYRRGIYRLKIARTFKPIEVNTPPDTDSAYLGKAGELGVMSELLFWGFNASLMLVDQGIDIVASKNGRYYHLQVKTSAQRQDGRFYFSIKSSSFEAFNNGSTFYVFVMRRATGSSYVIIPSTYIDTMRKVGAIKGEGSLSMYISSDEKGRVFTMNGKENVSHFVNNFGSIR